MLQTKDNIIKYKWIDQVENLDMYHPKGYHPVSIGDKLHDRYCIVDKLGHGGFATIWLALDESARQFVALKVGVANSWRAQNESEILRALNDTAIQQKSLAIKIQSESLIPTILDEFEVHGPNGQHPCFISALAQGDLKSSRQLCGLFPIRVTRALSAGLVLAVLTTHSRGYVHGDIHLRNVLVRMPASFQELSVEQYREEYGEPEFSDIIRVDGKPLTANAPRQALLPVQLAKKPTEFTLRDARAVLLNDFGEAFTPSAHQRLGKESGIPCPSRPPEAFFQPETPMTFSSDIWSLALAIWDIVGMKFLFCEHYSQEQVAAINIDVLGQDDFPQEWWTNWKDLASYFTHDDVSGYVPLKDRSVWPSLEEAFEQYVQKYRKQRPAAGAFGEDETRAFLDLMRKMLKFRPEERPTVQEVLQSEWMVKWALPEFGGIAEKDQSDSVVEPEQPEEGVSVKEENNVSETETQKKVVEAEQPPEVIEIGQLKDLEIKKDETRDFDK